MHAGVQITFTTFSVRRLLHEQKWYRRRKRLLEILEVGNDLDLVSRAYDFFSAFAIVLNLTASIMYTFDNLQAQYGSVLLWIERITVAFFCAGLCPPVIYRPDFIRGRRAYQPKGSSVKDP